MALRTRPFPALAAALVLGACSGDVPERPDVLLVIVDTLRADALGAWGEEPGVTPNLDAFAGRSVRFANCLTQAPNTATSHATLFTGLYPWTHRVANLTSLKRGTPGLPPVFETLAERLQSAGYRTAAFTDGGPLGTTWNLLQGFETLEAKYEGVAPKVDQALAWLETAPRDRPLFLLVHTYQVHLPYVAPVEWTERFASGYEGPLVSAVADIRAVRASTGEKHPDGKRMLRDVDSFTDEDWRQLRALYRAEVAYTDAELGRLLAETEPGGRLEGAVVALTSDHGEEFGEHGRSGHHQLHREVLHVPLLLRLPGREPAVVEEAVGLIDLFATLLELAAVPLPEVSSSRSLLPLLEGGRRAELPLFAETTEHLYATRRTPWQRAVRLPDAVYLSEQPQPSSSSEVREQLFDPARDPGETEDLLTGGDPAAAKRARALLEAHLGEAVELRLELLDGRSAAHVLPADEELAEELRALGYIDE